MCRPTAFGVLLFCVAVSPSHGLRKVAVHSQPSTPGMVLYLINEKFKELREDFAKRIEADKKARAQLHGRIQETVEKANERFHETLEGLQGQLEEIQATESYKMSAAKLAKLKEKLEELHGHVKTTELYKNADAKLAKAKSAIEAHIGLGIFHALEFTFHGPVMAGLRDLEAQLDQLHDAEGNTKAKLSETIGELQAKLEKVRGDLAKRGAEDKERMQETLDSLQGKLEELRATESYQVGVAKLAEVKEKFEELHEQASHTDAYKKVAARLAKAKDDIADKLPGYGDLVRLDGWIVETTEKLQDMATQFRQKKPEE